MPVYCSLYVDTRLMLGQSPLPIKRELRAVLDKLVASDPDLAELKLDQLVCMSQYPSECPPDELIFHSVQEAHRSVFGTKPEVITGAFFTDATELVRHGIPTLNDGPAGRTRAPALPRSGKTGWDPLAGEQVCIEDLVNCTKVYVSLILDLCTKSRVELGITP